MDYPLFLAAHSTYTHLIIGLFKGAKLLDETIIDHKKASKTFLLHLEGMLQKNHTTLSDCSFIVVHTGPGPFTTLRVLISSVNGLAYALSIPLVAVDGLTTLVNEYHHEERITIALLNAFCQDVYYALRTPTITTIGCASFEECIKNIIPSTVGSSPITLVGNAVALYYNQLSNLPHAHIPMPLPETCSLQALASTGLQQWYDQKNITDKVLPNYLKSSSAIIKT